MNHSITRFILKHSLFCVLILWSNKSISQTKYDETFINNIIEKYRGKVVYIDIWATWCGPCIAEMKNSKKLREKLQNEEVVFLYLCINSDNESSWKRIIASEQIEGQNYFLNREQSNMVARKFGVVAIPHYVMINKAGEIVDPNAFSPGHSRTLVRLKKLL